MNFPGPVFPRYTDRNAETQVLPATACVFAFPLLYMLLLTVWQYMDNVVGPGSPKYDNAYFEISYVRTYTTQVAVAPPGQPTSTTTGSLTVSQTEATSRSQTTDSSSADGDDPTPSPTSLAGGSGDNTSAAHLGAGVSFWVLLASLACVSVAPLLL